jgi:pimeloyl-ACP methyl ester carboxylesterase
MISAATTLEERPVYFSAGGEDLFGIITEPTTTPNGVGLVLLSGGAVPAASRNRVWVRVARQVAALGYHTLRFDYHGVGESTGVCDQYRLDRPFVDDVLGAVRCLEEHGVEEVILVGECFGARTALASVAQISNLRGIAVLAAPPIDAEMGTERIQKTSMSTYAQKTFRLRTVRDLFKPSRRREFARIARAKLQGMRSDRGTLVGADQRVSPLFAGPLAALSERGTPVLLVYGTEDREYAYFREDRDELAHILDAPGSTIDERVLPGEIHGLARLSVQDDVTDLIEKWLASLDAGGSDRP